MDEPGVWKPWKPFTAIASTRTDRGATAAEVKAFEGTLKKAGADAFAWRSDAGEEVSSIAAK